MVLWSTMYWMDGDCSHCRVCHVTHTPFSEVSSDDIEKKKKKGPASADLLQALTSYDLRALTFGRSAFVPLEGTNVHVARGGYTGEDGFEVSPPNHLPLAPFNFHLLPRLH
jgi:glycine cleavage system aminomethyltransferase T